FAHNLTQAKEIVKIWGKEKHWSIYENICIEDCPRCTYSPHNTIFEQVICKDNMSINFI
ncbi:hypothetical protein MHK_006678, partial [Candidatus Magnetomorum sp. HK-1]